MIGIAWLPQRASTGRDVKRLTLREQITVIIVTLTIFAAILMFGSDRNDFALLFSGLLSIELLSLLLVEKWAQTALAERGGKLIVPAGLFGTAIFAVAWSATPYGPNGPHPIWSYVEALPAIAIDRSAIYVGLLKLSGLAAAFLLGWLISSSDSRARYLLCAVVISTVVYGLWAILANFNPLFDIGLYGAFQGPRLAGSFQSANTAGTLFGITLVLAICFVFDASRRGDPGRGGALLKITAPLIGFLVIGTCLILTVSRGAAIATLTAAVTLFIWEIFARDWHGTQKRNLTYGFALALAILVLAWSGGVLMNRYADSVKDFIDQRQTVYSVHWNAFLASPWFGYGVGTFDEVNKLVQDALNYQGLWNLRAAHNVYLQWLEEGGLAAAIPMFACIGWVIFMTGLGTRNRRHMTTWLRGSVALSLVVLIHGWSDFSLQVPAIAMLWSVLLGSGYALSSSPKNKQAPLHTQRALKEEPPFKIKGFAVNASIVTLALGIAGLSIASWWEIDAPLGPTTLFLPLSTAYAYRAQKLLDEDAEGTNKPDAIQAARELTKQELQLSPALADGWLRLAVIASLLHESSADVGNLLDKSFLVAPLDAQMFAPRTRFILEHWSSIPGSVREETLEQIRVEWYNWIGKNEILELGKTIHNPAGRFAISFEIVQFNSRTGLVGKDK